VVILRDLTLNLPRTAVTALVGPSGAGKTSLLRLLNRLDDPTAGEVLFDQQPITGYPVAALRRRVGFVFQSPAMFPGTVEENLRTAVGLGGAGAAVEAPPIEGVLAAVGLSADYASREDRDIALAEWLRSKGVELVVCAGYMQLLRKPFFDYYGGRIVNTHSAPLPAFPGAHPIEDVLAAGVETTAATVHFVDEGIDTGPVIAAEPVPVLPDDTVESLRARVQAGVC
jgi:ABC-type Fe3+/spermidine/putrescine transport system ATPase subunit